MGTYVTKNYGESGDTQVIGGLLEIASGGAIKVLTGGKIVPNSGTQAVHIADASTSHNLNATFSDTEAETALNALGTKINAILAALEGAGILASS